MTPARLCWHGKEAGEVGAMLSLSHVCVGQTACGPNSALTGVWLGWKMVFVFKKFLLWMINLWLLIANQTEFPSELPSHESIFNAFHRSVCICSFYMQNSIVLGIFNVVMWMSSPLWSAWNLYLTHKKKKWQSGYNFICSN